MGRHSFVIWNKQKTGIEVKFQWLAMSDVHKIQGKNSLLK